MDAWTALEELVVREIVTVKTTAAEYALTEQDVVRLIAWRSRLTVVCSMTFERFQPRQHLVVGCDYQALIAHKPLRLDPEMDCPPETFVSIMTHRRDRSASVAEWCMHSPFMAEGFAMRSHHICVTGAAERPGEVPSTIRLVTDADAMMQALEIVKHTPAEVWRDRQLICRVPIQHLRDVHLPDLRI